ncbi:MAG: tyrosine-protein kinase family protein, partial [bacterium]
MSDKRREQAKKSASTAATVSAPVPPGELGTLVYAPGGEDWPPDFTGDGESRLLDLIDVDTTWDPRTLAATTQETRVLCVASDGAGAGTGVAIAQIARTLARAGRDVLVIDASVARPLMSKPFGYQPDEGLVDMVLFGTSPGAAVRKTASDKIRVLTVGSPPLQAAEIWSAKELGDVLTAFRSEWNAIVVHAPLHNDDGRVCEAVHLADALLVVLPASRAAGVERIASELATLGVSPRFLGVIATGRRGEVTPAPARKPASAPAP